MTAPEPFTGFPSTRWSLVGKLWHAELPVRREALAQLLKRYLPALRGYLVRARRIAPDRADDLLQSFLLCKVVEEDLLRQADPARGRFRGFLLKSLEHFVISQHRQETAQKRSGGAAQSLENKEPLSQEMLPEQVFDLQWAQALLAEAVQRMRAQCERDCRADVWGVFAHRVLADVEPGVQRLGYADLVKQFGIESPARAANVLVTGKRLFSRVLRELVMEYEPDEAGVEVEIAELRAVLARPRG